MNKKALILVVGLAVLVGGWALFRPEKIWLNQTVSETLPGAGSASAAASTVLASGQFHSVAHESRGTATIYQVNGGKRILRLTNFETSNGPALHVYFVAAPDATDSETVKNAGFVSIAPLKGNVGDQNYELPADLDLGKYQAVTVWCQRFGVNFATAPLTRNAQSSAQPVAVAAGQFRSVAHESKGTATVFQLADGKRILRLTDFATSNGPALHVYFFAAPDATDSDTVKNAGFVSIAPLKGNVGDQNYELPADLDLGKYQAVTIWCQRFGVNFATAPLTRQ